MPRSLHCTLTTPEQKVFEGEVQSVVVPASDGELGILARHAPLVGKIGFGELRLKVEGKGDASYFVDGGFLQVLDDQVSILAARAAPAKSLDAAAEEAGLRQLEAEKPPTGASIEAREEHTRSVDVARARLRLAKKG